MNSVTDGNFTAAVEELRGDIYFADDQLELARTAYQAAQAAAGPGGASSLLQLKLDSLPADPAVAEDTADVNANTSEAVTQ